MVAGAGKGNFQLPDTAAVSPLMALTALTPVNGINSSTQKYQSTQSNVALTSCRQDSGSPPF